MRKTKVNIVHILDNGEKVDSIENYSVPLNEKTKTAYQQLMGKGKE